MTRQQTIRQALKTYFGFDNFKGNQEDIISSLLDGKDVFVLMPTGGGKSLCYQLPALLSEGTAIVISPLIALMKNQVDAMRNFGEDPHIAHFLNSSLSKAAAAEVKKDVAEGRTKLLYVAPESLTKQENIDFLKSVAISFYAIDEAHCISEWGHDFRPEYRRIRAIINRIGVRPVIALTATATPKVQHDIQKTLGMKRARTFKSSFNRRNLFYEIRPKTKGVEGEIIKYIKSHPNASGIVYCLSRRKVDEMAEVLRANDIRVLPYHAGLDAATRAEHQDAFLNEKVDVIVATIAFGMGIDKPDVRYVIHYDIPKSLEGYYQETGRAGRDGAPAQCICFYSVRDIQKLYKLLQTRSSTEMEIGRQLLIETQAYAETSACRRKVLLHYFGEEMREDNCHTCDNCLRPRKEMEAGEELEDLLETVSLAGEYATTEYARLIMHGHRTTDVVRNGHTTLATFGCRSDSTEKHLATVIRQALLAGYLKKDVAGNGTLHVTEKGAAFIKHPGSFRIVADHDYSDTEGPELDQGNTAGVADPQLFSQLRSLRRQQADRLDLPPYVIFSDASLEAMSMFYPLTEHELLDIPGVGAGKARKYGKAFLEVIKRHVEQNEIERPTDIRVRTLAHQGSLRVYLVQGIDRHTPLDVLAKGKGIEMEELVSELETIVEGGTHIDITYHLRELVDDEGIEDLMDYFSQTEEDDIDEAYRELGEDYSEIEIRLGRIKFLVDVGN